VLVHGFSDRPESFLLMARRLADYDLILPGLPGFHDGRAAGAPAYDVGAYARWLADLLDHLGAGRSHLVGNSLGGATILKLAWDRPDQVQSLVLLDSGGCDAPEVDSVHDEVRAGKNLFEVRTASQLPDFLARIFHKPPPTPWPIGAFLAADLARKADTYAAIMADLLREGVMFEEAGAIIPLGRLGAPTLLVWGEFDSLFPLGIALHMAASIPGSRLEILRGCGHVPHIERPLRTAALCQDFWASLGNHVSGERTRS
jgi:pimeloyl-ACP methyl ester carboxylesterase